MTGDGQGKASGEAPPIRDELYAALKAGDVQAIAACTRRIRGEYGQAGQRALALAMMKTIIDAGVQFDLQVRDSEMRSPDVVPLPLNAATAVIGMLAQGENELAWDTMAWLGESEDDTMEVMFRIATDLLGDTRGKNTD